MSGGVDKSRYARYGFTIVELLLVVVIIAILAAITVVAYNGIQQRAINARIVSQVKMYRDGLIAYASVNGHYPSFAEGSVCLGVGYADRDGDGVPDCGSVGTSSHEQDAFDAELRKVLTSTPAIDNGHTLALWTVPPSEFVGAQLTYWDIFTVDGEAHPYFITYVVKGNDADCGISGIVRTDDDAGGYPKMRSGDFKNTWSDTTGSHSTSCTLPLPNPS